MFFSKVAEPYAVALLGKLSITLHATVTWAWRLIENDVLPDSFFCPSWTNGMSKNYFLPASFMEFAPTFTHGVRADPASVTTKSTWVTPGAAWAMPIICTKQGIHMSLFKSKWRNCQEKNKGTDLSACVILTKRCFGKMSFWTVGS